MSDEKYYNPRPGAGAVASPGQMVGGLTASGGVAILAERQLRIWAVERAIQCNVPGDQLLPKARELAEYVRSAKEPG